MSTHRGVAHIMSFVGGHTPLKPVGKIEVTSMFHSLLSDFSKDMFSINDGRILIRNKNTNKEYLKAILVVI